MKKIDAVLCAPHHIDYVWFRYSLKQFEPFFENIFIALTQNTVSPDLSDFFTKSKEYAHVHWIRPPVSHEATDWRDIALKDTIKNFAQSEYVLFLEQDFLMHKNVLEEATAALDRYDFVYHKEDERIHPAFALTRKDQVLETRLDFSASFPYDHFGRFFLELPYKNGASIRSLGLHNGTDFYHLNGLTQNYHVFKLGEQFYRPEDFLSYNNHCIELDIQQEPSFLDLQMKIRDKFGIGGSEAVDRLFL